jgi:hypothetical protein
MLRASTETMPMPKNRTVKVIGSQFSHRMGDALRPSPIPGEQITSRDVAGAWQGTAASVVVPPQQARRGNGADGSRRELWSSHPSHRMMAPHRGRDAATSHTGLLSKHQPRMGSGNGILKPRRRGKLMSITQGSLRSKCQSHRSALPRFPKHDPTSQLSEQRPSAGNHRR